MNQVHILLLEDNPLDAKLVAESLAKGAFECEIKSVMAKDSFYTAVQDENIDLILADHALLFFDGDSALDIVKEFCPDIPFIVISSIPDKESAIEMLKRGATDYILKQQLERLVPSVNRALRESGERGERRRIQELIRKAQAEWRATVDAISDLVILEGVDSRIRRCNKATAVFSDLNFLELVGKNIYELFWGDARKSASFSPSFNPLRANIWECQFPGKEGWFEITNYKIPSESGKESGWVHIVKDITQRRQSDARMRLLNTAIEQAADSILIADSTGIIRYVNPAFETTTGWSKSEALNHHFLSLQRRTMNLAVYKNIVDTLSKGGSWQGIYTSRRKDGTIYEEEATISPVRDKGGTLISYIAVRRDISERRHLEAITEAVNMMENAGYIFSGIRHELGNPINSIKTALTVLKNSIDRWDKKQVLNYVDRCLTEVGRVEYLLKALKTFSMHENPKLQRVKVASFLEQLCLLIESDFSGRGIEIKRSVDSSVGDCIADPRALHQVMLNIFSNAADALEERENPTVFVEASRKGARIEIKVVDNGNGMSEQQKADVFKPFYTTKPQGTGLGLVIVRKMMLLMNGNISINSQLSVGTEVILAMEAAPLE